jgi:hypothetical protein
MPKYIQVEMQEVFVHHLKQSVPTNVSLADDIAELLNISNDSAYRRLRCQTEFTLDETYKICSKYRLSLDSIFSNKGNTVTCNYNKLTNSAQSFETYLTSLLHQIQQMQKAEDVKLIYAAEEVPIVRSFHSAKLAAFKLFYWQRSVLNVPEYQHEKFTWDVIPQAQLDIAQQINAGYTQIESTEIWTSDTIQTNIKQVEYYFESGAFKHREDAITVLMELKTMLQLMSNDAEIENKNTNINGAVVPFSLYYSDLMIGTNCIHINSNDSLLSYISFNSLNSLATANQEFCGEIDQWMKNLIKKSTLISGVAEKQRFQFFNKAHKAIDDCIARINNS